MTQERGNSIMKKEKRFAVLIASSLTALFLCGCGISWDITENSEKIADPNMNEFVNPDNPEDRYVYVETGGRRYLLFGIQNKTLNDKQIGECIAYSEKDSNLRYYDVIGYDDFIAGFYVNGEMEQVHFLRDTETIGKDIVIPDFIDEFEYDIWK